MSRLARPAPLTRVIEQALQFRLARGDDPAVAWMATAAMHGQLAVESGVRVLAGTDSRAHGRVADEIRVLAATGMRPHDALAAGLWSARPFLALPGLAPGAPADVVIYDQDPGSACAASTTRARRVCAVRERFTGHAVLHGRAKAEVGGVRERRHRLRDPNVSFSGRP